MKPENPRIIELERKLNKLWDEMDKIDEELAELKRQEEATLTGEGR